MSESAPVPPAPSDDELRSLASRLSGHLLARGEMLAGAESCTGGLLAARCTDLAGSSRWFERGYVVYSNAAKTDLLDVPAGLIETDGAVSESVVSALVRGLLARTPARAGLAISGVAGPSGGTADKPVGLVWLAWGGIVAGTVCVETRRAIFPGTRDDIRRYAVAAALSGLTTFLVRRDATPAGPD